MKICIQQILLLTVMFVITGCQALPKSEALQIAHAAGLKNLKDVPHKKLEQALKEHPDMTTENVINVMGVGTKIFSQTTSWSLGAETGALALLALLEPVHQIEEKTRFLVWMPREEADSPEAAAVHFKLQVVDAFANALPEYKVSLGTKYLGGANAGDHGYLAVEGSGCEDCGVYSHPIFHYNEKPKKRKAPKNLGGYEAYRWGVGGRTDAAIFGFPMEAANLKPEERLNILTRVSKYLPEWVYIYVAPDEKLASFPVLLHQGKPMFFVEPAAP